MTFKFRAISELMPEKIELETIIILCVETPVIRQVFRDFTKDKMPKLILETAFPTAHRPKDVQIVTTLQQSLMFAGQQDIL
ncbi:hypothetical protein NM09_20430 [Vibrio caribbeanicus]|uniref:Uncharacterized protein n=1 Tax=Vibrio caribbeanicus TaxID=701175 RepID=A0ACC4NQR6_9VIBR|nr:hypothetical protein NM09_20430 [Vibrio caribbeanicus]